MMQVISYKHKGLQRFVQDGDTTGISPLHAARIRKVLRVLLKYKAPALSKFRSLGLHPILDNGNGSVRYAVFISGPWRLMFSRDRNGNLVNLDYLNYH